MKIDLRANHILISYTPLTSNFLQNPSTWNPNFDLWPGFTQVQKETCMIAGNTVQDVTWLRAKNVDTGVR